MIKRLLPFTLVIAMGVGAAAQTSTASQANSVSPANPAAEPALTSNGPVTLDYKVVSAPSADPAEAAIAKKVRDQLLKLPYYSMFDDLEYSVQGRTVTLSGAVTSLHSQTRQDAERAVKRIEGVDKVVNNIEILPPSPIDQQIRERVRKTIYSYGPLFKYSRDPNPPIRIIVKNSRVTLEGVVDSEGDKNLCTLRVNQISSVLSVTNNLRVVK